MHREQYIIPTLSIFGLDFEKRMKPTDLPLDTLQMLKVEESLMISSNLTFHDEMISKQSIYQIEQFSQQIKMIRSSYQIYVKLQIKFIKKTKY